MARVEPSHESLKNAGEAPCHGCGYRPVCCAGAACSRFITFVETGRASGPRIPSAALFSKLFPGTIDLKALRKKWHSEGRALATAVLRGQRAAMSQHERQRRWREHLKVLLELDPQFAEAHRARKRLDARRRSRLRGHFPMTFARASARSKAMWARKHDEAIAAGLAMTPGELAELRVRMGMSQRELGAAIGWRRTNVESWERNERGPPPSAVVKLRAIAQGEVPAAR